MDARRSLSLAVVLFLAACQHPPPPKPPPPAEPAPAEPPTAPPPPPKCEAIDEGCVAKEDARVTIANADLTIAVPAGWTYAHAADGVIAVMEGAAFAVEARKVSDPKRPPRDEALTTLMSKAAITLPKSKGKIVWPRKPDKKLTVEKLNVSLYQFDGAVRGSKHGPLLVFTATLPAGPILSGVGFVADDDTSNADAAILKAISSMASAPQAPRPDG